MTATTYLEHFRRRVLQDALSQATGRYWERRAAVFDWAAPRPGDFNGNATDAELADRAQRCRESAEACRRQAILFGAGDPIDPLMVEVFAEVAA